VRAALGLSGPERFFTASARHVGPMARVAVLEVVVVAVLAGILFFGVAAAAVSGLGNSMAWITLGIAGFVLAFVTSFFDYARVAVVARDDRSAIRGLADAMKLFGQRPIAVVVLAVLNGVLALVVLVLLLEVHGMVRLDTTLGMLLGVVVGQFGVLARVWSRVAAYGAEASLAARV